MTETEQSVVGALGYSESATTKMMPVIQRYIKAARADMIRSGLSRVLAESEHPLVVDAITSFCLYKMDDEQMREKYYEEYITQADNLRKSTITLDNSDSEPDLEVEQSEE